MSAELNHTIVRCTDKVASARFLAEILGLDEPTQFGPFRAVQLANGVSMDYADDHGRPHPLHSAFLVSEAEFDDVHRRIIERGITYWADPFHRIEGEINTNDGGRGLYWNDPDGHILEAITVPYGGG
jgi:catechol 2,3-dioxygenase-like lactoylglutathione lyase family enzyme